MSDLRKAAEAALAAIDYMLNNGEWYQAQDRADALRAALAQPEQEPVAYLWQHGETGRTRVIEKDQVWTASNQWNRVGPLYLHPPQRKPLTEEEIYKLFGWYAVPFVRAVERAHGIGGEE